MSRSLANPSAVLALENGRLFEGSAFGARGRAEGELIFNTSTTGYQEILTDPSYHGQIVVMTHPHIGNTGVNREDPESGRPHVRGFVARAVRGTERGMHDAMELLRAFTSREAELEAESTRTLRSIRAGLERFVDDLQSIPALREDEAGTPTSGVTTSTH